MTKTLAPHNGPVPMELLRGYPERMTPRLSPDGSRLAFLAPHNGVMNVWVGTTAVEDARPVTDAGGIGVYDYGWAYTSQHIIFQQDHDGDEVFHVHSVHVESGRVRDCTPFSGALSMFLAASPRHPSRVIVGCNRDNPVVLDAYEIDLEAESIKKVESNPGFDGWLVDHELNVRGGTIVREDGGSEYLIRDGGTGEFRSFITMAPPDYMINMTEPVRFNDVGDAVYFRSAAGASTTQLVRYDARTGESTVIAGDPKYDVMTAGFDPVTNAPQFASFGGPRARYQVIDPALKDDFALLADFDDGDIEILSRDQNDMQWIVAYIHAAGPTRYVHYARASGLLTELFQDQPMRAAWRLAPLEPFTFRARDGLEIEGFLTFPPDAERRDLPLIINVHGGPWGSRDWYWCHPEAQWAATRGYLHMQVNYRGSGGYGKAFFNASAGEFAGAMQNDLLDGLEWAVRQGYADHGRVAIMGWSYGGYAALVGAAFTPDVFRCAIAGVGPSNLVTLIESFPDWYVEARAQWTKLMGHPVRDREFLLSRSPITRVGDIRIPLLICQGANDPRVTKAETDEFVAALQARNVPHEYLVFDDEGHGLAKHENRLAFYHRAEEFLAEHMGRQGA
jgi:dipeptidyl aminopeptidase/acylaminoacyl peptidase